MADHTRRKGDSFGSTGNDDKQVLLPVRAVIVLQERSVPAGASWIGHPRG